MKEIIINPRHFYLSDYHPKAYAAWVYEQLQKAGFRLKPVGAIPTEKEVQDALLPPWEIMPLPNDTIRVRQGEA